MRDFAPVDTDTYPVAKAALKIHDRPVIGFYYYYNPKQDRNILISVASDSVKTWTANSFGDELDLAPLLEYSKIRCGSQSYDIHPNGKCILVCDTMNTLHVINEENGALEGITLDEGLMQILYCKFSATKNQIFSINFVHGMQAFDLDGKNHIKKPLDKKKLVSAVNFSPQGKYLVIGYETGLVEIRDGQSWDLLFPISDAHAKKIRVVEYTHDDQKVLIGSDDKTLSLHAMMDVTSTKLRSFTYHSAPILSAAFDFATESSLFASGSADKRVILWDTDSGTPLQVFQKCFEEQVITAVNFSYNGRYLFSGTANGQIVAHKITSVLEEPAPDVEMTEIREEIYEETVVETYADESSQISDYEGGEVEAALENVDISDSEEEPEEKEHEQEAPASPTGTPNGDVPASLEASPVADEPASLEASPIADAPQSPPLSPDDGFDESTVPEESGDIPMSPDE